MLTVEVIVRDEEGVVKLRMEGDACKPLQIKTPYEHPVVDRRVDEGGGKYSYQIFALTYQPSVNLAKG